MGKKHQEANGTDDAVHMEPLEMRSMEQSGHASELSARRLVEVAKEGLPILDEDHKFRHFN
jgi:hypothetical protein